MFVCVIFCWAPQVPGPDLAMISMKTRNMNEATELFAKANAPEIRDDFFINIDQQRWGQEEKYHD